MINAATANAIAQWNGIMKRAKESHDREMRIRHSEMHLNDADAELVTITLSAHPAL